MTKGRGLYPSNPFPKTPKSELMYWRGVGWVQCDDNSMNIHEINEKKYSKGKKSKRKVALNDDDDEVCIALYVEKIGGEK